MLALGPVNSSHYSNDLFIHNTMLTNGIMSLVFMCILPASLWEQFFHSFDATFFEILRTTVVENLTVNMMGAKAWQT